MPVALGPRSAPFAKGALFMESINTSKRKLNIFIDESGSQSPCGSRLTHDIERPQESFYIVSFVFHREYITSIKYFINNINSLCEKYNLKEHYIHFAPLIHGSDNFKNYTFDDILNIVYFFNA